MRLLLIGAILLNLNFLVSCGMPEMESTETRKFSLQELRDAGLHMRDYKFSFDSQTSFVIVCDINVSSEASQRILLLKKLKIWASNSKGDLYIGNVSISEAVINRAVTQAISELSKIDSRDTNCPSQLLASTYM